MGIFVNDSNYASWLIGLELRRRQASVHSRLSPRQGKPLVEPCFLRVEEAVKRLTAKIIFHTTGYRNKRLNDSSTSEVFVDVTFPGQVHQ